MLILTIIYLGLCCAVGMMGSKRECGFILAFLITLCTTPLVGAIIVLLFRKKKTQLEMMVEANTLLSSGILTPEQHKKMILDITTTGKHKKLKYYTQA